MTDERYVVRQESGELEVQQRRRESWRAADGWAWARQTGFDPGQFIFRPDSEWTAITQVEPSAAEVKKAIRPLLGGVPSASIDDAEFNFVVGLFGVETLPAHSLSKEHRRALIGALALNAGVTVMPHVSDPLGRESIRVSFRDVDDRPEATQSIYLDRDYQYLADRMVATGSDESGLRIVIQRHQVSHIPDELLALVGSERVEKAEWN